MQWQNFWSSYTKRWIVVWMYNLNEKAKWKEWVYREFWTDNEKLHGNLKKQTVKLGILKKLYSPDIPGQELILHIKYNGSVIEGSHYSIHLWLLVGI